MTLRELETRLDGLEHALRDVPAATRDQVHAFVRAVMEALIDRQNQLEHWRAEAGRRCELYPRCWTRSTS